MRIPEPCRMHQKLTTAALKAHRTALDARPPRVNDAGDHMARAQDEIAAASRLDNRPMPIDKRKPA